MRRSLCAVLRTWSCASQLTAPYSSGSVRSAEMAASVGGAGTAGAAASAAAPALRPVELVVAATEKGGIGKNGALPWELPTDMARFKEVTSKTLDPRKTNAVIMGRKTWASIPTKFRPLRGRLNVVLSRAADVRTADALPDDVLTAGSLVDAVRLLSAAPYTSSVETIFIIGGAAAFAEALAGTSAADAAVTGAGVGDGVVCGVVHLTTVFADIECDVAIPGLDDKQFALTDFGPKCVENGLTYQFRTYKNRSLYRLQRSPAPALCGGCAPIAAAAAGVGPRHEEHQYLDCIRDILATGVERSDRTGVGTIGKFGVQMRFSLRDDVLPLLTTKKVFWRGVAEELLWFISGDTRAKTLQDKGVHIWDGNASRDFLDKSGLSHREVGDLGPVYGFQWRHFGATYTDMHADYTGKGVDQLAEVIHKLKTNPTDRRIILSAWNPAALKEMALPPCHMFAQFYVADGELSCQMYQRSGDMGLGIPFNIASYALLTRLLAQVAGLKAGEFVHVIGDAHVYSNHVEPLMLQLEREPRPFPKLTIDPTIKDIDAFRIEHLTVEGYDPHPTIKMDMAV